MQRVLISWSSIIASTNKKRSAIWEFFSFFPNLSLKTAAVPEDYVKIKIRRSRSCSWPQVIWDADLMTKRRRAALSDRDEPLGLLPQQRRAHEQLRSHAVTLTQPAWNWILTESSRTRINISFILQVMHFFSLLLQYVTFQSEPFRDLDLIFRFLIIFFLWWWNQSGNIKDKQFYWLTVTPPYTPFFN